MERFAEANFQRVNNKSGFLMVSPPLLPASPTCAAHLPACLSGHPEARL